MKFAFSVLLLAGFSVAAPSTDKPTLGKYSPNNKMGSTSVISVGTKLSERFLGFQC
jgi:hypothetical protein